MVDEHPSHRLGGSGKKVAPIGEYTASRGTNEPQIGLVNQGRGVQRVARCLIRDVTSRELAQLVVHDRQKLRRGLRIAIVDGVKNSSDLIHDVKDNWRGDGKEGSRPARGPGTPDQRLAAEPAYGETRATDKLPEAILSAYPPLPWQRIGAKS